MSYPSSSSPSYHPPYQPYNDSASEPSVPPQPTTSPKPQHRLEHLELEWSVLLPGGHSDHNFHHEHDHDDLRDPNTADSMTTATHSSPLSMVRTPPEFVFSAAPATVLAGRLNRQQQQLELAKQDDGVLHDGACFHLGIDGAVVVAVAGELEAHSHNYSDQHQPLPLPLQHLHSGVTEFDMDCDPFGLDASLFSI